MVILLYGHVRTPPWCHEFCRPGTHRMPQLQRFLLEDMDVNDPIPSHRVRSFSYWNQSFFSRNHLKPVILQFSQFSATQWLDPTPITRSQSLQTRPDCLGFHGADISILRPWRWEIWKATVILAICKSSCWFHDLWGLIIQVLVTRMTLGFTKINITMFFRRGA